MIGLGVVGVASSPGGGRGQWRSGCSFAAPPASCCVFQLDVFCFRTDSSILEPRVVWNILTSMPAGKSNSFALSCAVVSGCEFGRMFCIVGAPTGSGGVPRALVLSVGSPAGEPFTIPLRPTSPGVGLCGDSPVPSRPTVLLTSSAAFLNLFAAAEASVCACSALRLSAAAALDVLL